MTAIVMLLNTFKNFVLIDKFLKLLFHNILYINILQLYIVATTYLFYDLWPLFNKLNDSHNYKKIGVMAVIHLVSQNKFIPLSKYYEIWIL
jgi:hypothetical protein